MQVYIKSRSKAEFNRILTEATVKQVGLPMVRHYHIGGLELIALEKVPLGSPVKFYTKEVQGSPYATSYGTLAKKKTGEVYIK